MSEVKWIKINVDFLDGFSFKCMRKAKVDGVADLRDKLEAVWFELLALAGRSNDGGKIIDNVIDNTFPFRNFSDIATMLDRSDEEIKICMDFYLQQGMISYIDKAYSLSNWSKYQNTEELNKIRCLNNSDRQKRFKENHPDYYKQRYLESKGEKSNDKKEVVTEECKKTHFDNVIDNAFDNENNATDKIRLEEERDKNKNTDTKINIDKRSFERNAPLKIEAEEKTAIADEGLKEGDLTKMTLLDMDAIKKIGNQALSAAKSEAELTFPEKCKGMDDKGWNTLFINALWYSAKRMAIKISEQGGQQIYSPKMYLRTAISSNIIRQLTDCNPYLEEARRPKM